MASFASFAYKYTSDEVIVFDEAIDNRNVFKDI